MDNKRRFYRLIEKYINEFKGDAVKLIYGEGSFIKIHTISFGVTTNVIQLEAVVVLGEVINEDVIDNSLAETLIRESLFYFFPNCLVKTYIRFDV